MWRGRMVHKCTYGSELKVSEKERKETESLKGLVKMFGKFILIDIFKFISL